MSQIDWVKVQLKKGRLISHKTANEEYGISRLASIICKLREKGWIIASIETESVNPYTGNVSRYAKYKLEMLPNDA